jgi:2-dehydropantoate 2-reductase
VGKLVLNLGNAVEAISGPAARGGELTRRARDEAYRCLHAAGIDFVGSDEDRARRGNLLDLQSVAGQPRRGGSSWQSLARRTGSIETDYLNGEIVRLGRLHGVPTPCNELLQPTANGLARERREPGCIPEADVLRLLDGA